MDLHIFPFFYPIITFSNSFFDFPLFFEYLLIILDNMYAALSAVLDAHFLPEGGNPLTSTLHFCTVWRELGYEDNRAEKAD